MQELEYLIKSRETHFSNFRLIDENLKVAYVPIAELIFKWFDYTLKDGPRPEILKDKVNFEVMGENEWMHVPTLGDMSNDTLNFYLGNSAAAKTYPLLNSKPAKKGFIAYDPHLKDRSNSHFSEIDDDKPTIDTVLRDIKDKLIFKSNPMKRPLIISGSFKASLMASVNKKDMDIVIDIYEQTRDGKYFFLNSNIERASMVKDRSKRHLLTANKPVVIEMKDNFITSRQLQTGSRIVVVLGVNKNPDWQINYGSGKDVSDETMADAVIPMKVKLYNNSVIKIPILKPK